MGPRTFFWARTKEIISDHQAIFTNRESDQRSSTRKANHRCLSSPAGQYLLVVVVDFDKQSWEADACAFLKMCRETGMPASLERSRSGSGAHVWIFFASPVLAALARKFASANLTRTMERRYAVGLHSYYRLFPSQDTMPKGGFGNLIALPLQHGPREKRNSVFVDDQLRPFDDQWAFLSSIRRLAPDEAQALLRKVYPASDVINVRHGATDYDGANYRWILPPSERV